MKQVHYFAPCVVALALVAVAMALGGALDGDARVMAQPGVASLAQDPQENPQAAHPATDLDESGPRPWRVLPPDQISIAADPRLLSRLRALQEAQQVPQGPPDASASPPPDDSADSNATTDARQQWRRLLGDWVGPPRPSILGPVMDHVVFSFEAGMPIVTWTTIPQVGPAAVSRRPVQVDPQRQRLTAPAPAETFEYRFDEYDRLKIRFGDPPTQVLLRRADGRGAAPAPVNDRD